MVIKLTVKATQEKMLNVSHQWQLGTCVTQSASYVLNHTYEKYERCCLLPGVHALSCQNEKGPFGWGKSSIEIQGQLFCDDFVGYKAMRHVLIQNECKYLKQHYANGLYYY